MPDYSFELFNSNPRNPMSATPTFDEWTKSTNRMFAGRPRNSVPIPDSHRARNIVPKGAGDQAEGIANVMSRTGNVHDAFTALKMGGGGKAAAHAIERAMTPTSYLLSAAGAEAAFTASQQRQEPVDVSLARAISPVVGSAVGDVAGTGIGGIVGAGLGSAIPFAGTGAGATIGGAAGGGFGSYVGDEAGNGIANWYARQRGYGQPNE